jgi:hypothetical protein
VITCCSKKEGMAMDPEHRKQRWITQPRSLVLG